MMKPRIAVIGVGGAGGNAVNNMIAAGLTGYADGHERAGRSHERPAVQGAGRRRVAA